MPSLIHLTLLVLSSSFSEGNELLAPRIPLQEDDVVSFRPLGECLRRLYTPVATLWKHLMVLTDGEQKSSDYATLIAVGKPDLTMSMLKFDRFRIRLRWTKNLDVADRFGAIFLIGPEHENLTKLVDVFVRLPNMDMDGALVFYSGASPQFVRSVLERFYAGGLYRILAFVLEDDTGGKVLLGSGLQTMTEDCRLAFDINLVPCDEVPKIVYPDDRLDFGGCALNVSAILSPPYGTVSKRDSDGHPTEIGGIETEIVRALAADMNFAPNFRVREDQLWGAVLENDTSIGLVGEVYTGSSEMGYGIIWPMAMRKKYVSESVPYDNDCFTWAVPPHASRRRGRRGALAGYLTSGFSGAAWFGILASLATIPLAMYLFSRSGSIRDDFETTAFVALGIVLQKPLPDRYQTARDSLKLLLVFLYLYTAIVSTAYAAALASSVILPPVPAPHIADFDEVLEANLTLATDADFSYAFTLFEDAVYRRVARDLALLADAAGRLDEISRGRRVAYARNARTLDYYRSGQHRGSRETFHVLDGCFVSLPINMIFRKNSIYVERANFVIRGIVEGGLVEYWTPHLLPPGKKWYTILNKDFEPETFEKIGVVLQMYFVGNAFAFSAFTGEVLCYYLNVWVRKMREKHPYYEYCN